MNLGGAKTTLTSPRKNTRFPALPGCVCPKHPSIHEKPSKGCSNPAAAGISPPPPPLQTLPAHECDDAGVVLAWFSWLEAGGKARPTSGWLWEERELCWLLERRGERGTKSSFFFIIIFYFAECSFKTIQALLLLEPQQQLGSFQCREV